jgi:hypothetical protein
MYKDLCHEPLTLSPPLSNPSEKLFFSMVPLDNGFKVAIFASGIVFRLEVAKPLQAPYEHVVVVDFMVVKHRNLAASFSPLSILIKFDEALSR